VTKQTPFNRAIRRSPQTILQFPRRATEQEAHRERLFSELKARLRKREGPMRTIRKADK
jgi:hypothetical protein